MEKKYIRCIDNAESGNYITKGKEYIILEISSGHISTALYKIIDDRNQFGQYYVKRFSEPYTKPEQMKLEITKEKVLAAASKCSQAKETLKTLFPEVFEEEIDLAAKTGIGGYKLFLNTNETGDFLIAVRSAGTSNLRNKAFYLSTEFNWALKTDNHDVLCLIPTKKN